MTENLEDTSWFKELGESEQADVRLSRLYQTHAARGSLEAFFEMSLDLPRIMGWRRESTQERER